MVKVWWANSLIYDPTQMITDDGFAFDANIPVFTLSLPNALH
jgi:uncharacterized protein affecting Mg2+/Co2+ transport